MSPPPPYAAAVLAGGHSTRMGRDKATVPHPATGAPLLLRQLNLLSHLHPAPVQLLVSARFGQLLPPLPPATQRIDDDGSRGPLGGLVTALATSSSTHLLVIAVDLPALETPTLQALLANRIPGQGRAITHNARLQPLVALYPTSFLATATQALDAGHPALTPLITAELTAGRFQAIPLPSDPSVLSNWNTPADFPETN